MNQYSNINSPAHNRTLQSKKQRLKEKIEEDVGALVQFLLDERDSLLESLDAEEVAAMAVIDDNLKTVETEEEAIDKAVVNIHNHISGKTSFEVSVWFQIFKSQTYINLHTIFIFKCTAQFIIFYKNIGTVKKIHIRIRMWIYLRLSKPF